MGAKLDLAAQNSYNSSMETASATWSRFKGRITVDPITNCWVWQAGRDHDGYGRFTINGREWRAHIFSYTLVVGPVPKGKILDHFVCDRRECVNPYHVRPATHRENLLRSPLTVASRNKTKTHCSRGHEYNNENTLIIKTVSGFGRDCRICRYLRNKDRKRKR